MDDPLLTTFISEAKVRLAETQLLLQGLDRRVGMADSAEINACYRAIHTLGGLADYLALERILLLTHGAERLLEDMRTNRILRGAVRIDALLRAVTRLIELVACLENDTAPSADDLAIISELWAWTTRPASTPRCHFRRCDDRSVRRFSQYGNQIPSGPPRRPPMFKAGYA